MSFLKAILIIGFYQTVILGGILLLRKNRNKPDYFLATLFFVYGVTLLLAYLEIYNRENNYPFPFLINSSTPFILLHGPLLWFYIKSLTTPLFRLKLKYILHFVPFVFVTTLMSLNLYLLPSHERILIDSTEAFKSDISFPLIILLIAIFTQGYFIWGLLLLRSYNLRIRHYFSEISEINLAWLRILLSICIVFYAGNSLLYITDYIFNIFSYHALQTIGYAYASLFILVLGYRGYRQGHVFSSRVVDQEMSLPEKTISSHASGNEEEKAFILRLIDYMEKEKPHVKPELTLSALAAMLGESPDRLSSVLNGTLGKNFFDFVNHYRIEEFKSICREGLEKNYTIMGMAWDAGFNSKATFNRVFKKMTGLTPGEYLASLK
jgi:AraC-like DNA-binding protein